MSPAASVLLDHAGVSAADRAIINRANSQHSTGPAPPPKPPWSSTSLASQEAIDQISKLGLYTSRLSRQFQNTVKQLREIQDDRRLEERRQLRAAADLLVEHERKQIPWDPADDGFVFSRSQVEQFATREIRLNDAHLYCSAAFDIPPSFAAASLRRMRARNELAC